MSVHHKLTAALNASRRFCLPAILLIMVIIVSCPIRAATLVNADVAADPVESVNYSWPFIGAGGNAAVVARGLPALPWPALADGTTKLQWGKILKEVAKQAVDQPGHFLIAATPIWASRYLVGVPWYGWAIAPLLAYREWRQWPSNRWWDPPLDWAFLSLGALVATRRRRPRQRLLDGRPALRRRIARAWSFRLARQGAGTPDLVHTNAGLAAGTARTHRWVSAAAEAGFRR
jgi:hypothetical protein